MQDTTAQELLLSLLNQAQEEHTKFHQINTFSEFIYYKSQSRALKVVLKVLRDSANFVFKSYCSDVVNTTADYNKLLAYKQLEQVISYYEQERKVINDMITDYDDYLAEGNFISALFGAERGNLI